MSEQLTSELGRPSQPGCDAPHEGPTAANEAALNRISDRPRGDLFVEAGAGAGKTSSLVERIVNLVEMACDITAIAAITFTEKAAAELRTGSAPS